MRYVRAFAILFLTLLAAYSPIPALCEHATVGAQAPTFSLMNAQGKPVSFSQFAGKVVVLEWFNHSCPFVKKFYQNGDMQAFQKRSREKGAVWLTINSSAEGKQGHIARDQAQAIASEHALDPEFLLLDPEGTVGKLYGAKVTPHMFVVNAQGNLAYAGAIDSQATTRASDIPGATNYVMQTVEALAQGRTPEITTTDAYGCGVKYK